MCTTEEKVFEWSRDISVARARKTFGKVWRGSKDFKCCVVNTSLFLVLMALGYWVAVFSYIKFGITSYLGLGCFIVAIAMCVNCFNLVFGEISDYIELRKTALEEHTESVLKEVTEKMNLSSEVKEFTFLLGELGGIVRWGNGDNATDFLIDFKDMTDVEVTKDGITVKYMSQEKEHILFLDSKYLVCGLAYVYKVFSESGLGEGIVRGNVLDLVSPASTELKETKSMIAEGSGIVDKIEEAIKPEVVEEAKSEEVKEEKSEVVEEVKPEEAKTEISSGVITEELEAPTEVLDESETKKTEEELNVAESNSSTGVSTESKMEVLDKEVTEILEEPKQEESKQEETSNESEVITTEATVNEPKQEDVVETKEKAKNEEQEKVKPEEVPTEEVK